MVCRDELLWDELAAMLQAGWEPDAPLAVMVRRRHAPERRGLGRCVPRETWRIVPATAAVTPFGAKLRRKLSQVSALSQNPGRESALARGQTGVASEPSNGWTFCRGGTRVEAGNPPLLKTGAALSGRQALLSALTFQGSCCGMMVGGRPGLR